MNNNLNYPKKFKEMNFKKHHRLQTEDLADLPGSSTQQLISIYDINHMVVFSKD